MQTTKTSTHTSEGASASTSTSTRTDGSIESSTRTIEVPFDGSTVSVRVDVHGEGRPVLLLHGGGGTVTVDAFARRLAAERDLGVIVPTHPGFGGTARPEGLASIRGLARLYAALLDQEGLSDVTVIGNSIGGWIAAELAALSPTAPDATAPRATAPQATAPRATALARLVVIDGAGLEVPGHPVADFFSLTFDELADLSYARPDTFRIVPEALPESVRAVMAGNRAALLAYASTAMVDPTLGERLGDITIPTLVIWGERDRMIEPEVGEGFAAAISGARLRVLSGTGHLPQLETPEAVLAALDEFLPAARSSSL